MWILVQFFTWKVSGGTVLANISYLDLSLSALAVEAGEIWGIRNKRRRLATWKKVRKLSFFYVRSSWLIKQKIRNRLQNFEWSTSPQCGNYWTFLSLRFYVKSNLAKLVILAYLEGLNFDFMNFCTFWRLKFTNLTEFRASKMAKTAVLELQDPQKLISRNIWVK